MYSTSSSQVQTELQRFLHFQLPHMLSTMQETIQTHLLHSQQSHIAEVRKQFKQQHLQWQLHAQQINQLLATSAQKQQEEAKLFQQSLIKQSEQLKQCFSLQQQEHASTCQKRLYNQSEQLQQCFSLQQQRQQDMFQQLLDKQLKHFFSQPVSEAQQQFHSQQDIQIGQAKQQDYFHSQKFSSRHRIREAMQLVFESTLDDSSMYSFNFLIELDNWSQYSNRYVNRHDGMLTKAVKGIFLKYAKDVTVVENDDCLSVDVTAQDKESAQLLVTNFIENKIMLELSQHLHEFLIISLKLLKAERIPSDKEIEYKELNKMHQQMKKGMSGKAEDGAMMIHHHGQISEKSMETSSATSESNFPTSISRKYINSGCNQHPGPPAISPGVFVPTSKTSSLQASRSSAYSTSIPFTELDPILDSSWSPSASSLGSSLNQAPTQMRMTGKRGKMDAITSDHDDLLLKGDTALITVSIIEGLVKHSRLHVNILFLRIQRNYNLFRSLNEMLDFLTNRKTSFSVNECWVETASE